MNKPQKFSGIKTKKIVLVYNLLKAAQRQQLLYQYLTEISVLLTDKYTFTKISSRYLITEVSHSIAHHFLLRDPFIPSTLQTRITSR
jgi:hypothetical protein